MNETLFRCSSNCTLECESTYFTGTAYFSQLSYQSTSLQINNSIDVITSDYITSIELAHRINHDMTLFDVTTTLYEQTKSLLKRLDGFVAAATAFNAGFNNTSFLYVMRDMEQFCVIIENYMTFYQSTYKVMRWRAVDYVSQTVKQVQDLSYELETAPSSFHSFYEAQWFYTSLSPLLDKSIVNMKLASTFLSKVQSDEVNIKSVNSPNRFYLQDYDKAFCHNMYSVISQIFDRIVPILSYASQKISQWLLDNSKNITYSTAYKFSNFSAEKFADQSGHTSNIPNLWTLLKCYECDFASEVLNYSVWSKLVEQLSESLSDTTVLCLLQYEQTLEVAYNVSKQQLPLSPEWMLGDILSSYSTDLKLNLEAMDALLHAYATGTVTLQETIANIGHLVQIMSDNVVNIESKISSSSAEWQNDVIVWQNNLSAVYASIINNVIGLSQFLFRNANISSFSSSLSIWYLHKVLLDVIYSNNETLADFPALIPLFKENLTEFLKLNSTEVIKETLSRVINNNVVYSQIYYETIKACNDQWVEKAKEVQQTIDVYNSYFIVDDLFIE